MSTWITKIWPLPSVERRRLWPFFFTSKIMKKGCQVERDGDYLFYQTGSLIEKISFFALGITFLDLYFGSELLVDQELLATNKTVLIAAWGKIMGPVILILGWSAYLRIRLPMDIAKERIPFFLDKNFLRPRSRREWTQIASVIVVLLLIIFPLMLPNFLLGEDNILNKFFSIRSNVNIAIGFEVLYAVIAGGGTATALSSALIWEKSFRYYDKSRDDMEEW